MPPKGRAKYYKNPKEQNRNNEEKDVFYDSKNSFQELHAIYQFIQYTKIKFSTLINRS